MKEAADLPTLPLSESVVSKKILKNREICLKTWRLGHTVNYND